MLSSQAFKRRCSRLPENFTAIAIAFLIAPEAFSQTDEIQVYDADINSPGQLSLQLHNNYTPIGRKISDFRGGIVAQPHIERRRRMGLWADRLVRARCLRAALLVDRQWAALD